MKNILRRLQSLDRFSKLAVLGYLVLLLAYPAYFVYTHTGTKLGVTFPDNPGISDYYARRNNPPRTVSDVGESATKTIASSPQPLPSPPRPAPKRIVSKSPTPSPEQVKPEAAPINLVSSDRPKSDESPKPDKPKDEQKPVEEQSDKPNIDPKPNETNRHPQLPQSNGDAAGTTEG